MVLGGRRRAPFARGRGGAVVAAHGRGRASELGAASAPLTRITRREGLRVAYADGRLDRDEDHFVRKISHLLHVPNTECMLARSRAKAQH
ncbi:MAG: hypothetical protein GEV05_00055 [Betaproteobacteria bacterium]|nr:hypothetical protein [Betaproteobacteria bacterium]